MTEVETDFVVVGAGSSGCVLANRLSANEKNHVALLEAGPPDRSFWIHLPIGYAKTMWDKRLNWAFHTEPEQNLGGRRIYWPRGKTLGGSSSINGLIAIRGQVEDYDLWRALGNPGWAFRDVLPYFIKSENNDVDDGQQLHGKSGPVTVTSIRHRHELIEAAIAAAERLGIARTTDFNGRQQEGVGYYQLTTSRGLRMSAARAYLAPIRRRANLKIITNAQAIGIIFDGKMAVGVRYRTAGRQLDIRARRGVVLAAGAIQSPHLLMLSGIGPADHLRAHGIATRVNRPAVGKNLQDHLQVRLIYRTRRPITTNDQLNSLLGRVRIGMQWALKRAGPLAIGINQGALFTRVMPEAKRPDIQLHIATLSADMAGAKPHPYSGCTISVCQLRPESRGEVTLASADPMATPKMHANYLAAEVDRRCITAGVAFVRRLANTEPLSSEIDQEMLPGPDAKTDEDLLQFVRGNGASIFHPVGTCRMGSDDDAVVDPRLRVRGVAGLWIADCSIMPTLVSGNTNLPAIMIGEKAADMILKDAAAEAFPAARKINVETGGASARSDVRNR